MALTRRTLVAASTLGAATLAAPFIRVRPANAAEFNLKYGSSQQASYPIVVRMQEAARKIAEESGGRIDISVFPNSQLGGDTVMLGQLRAGGLDFLNQSGLILANLTPLTSINGLGFAFKDYAQVWAAMDGDLGAMIRKSIADANLYAFEKIWDNGYRQITSGTRQISTPADLNNFKIRVPISPLWVSMFKGFGAAPTGINIAETYTALQTRVVDGQENPLTTVEVRKFYEVQKYLSLTNHMWDGFWMLASGRTWNRLPDPLKTIIAKHVNGAALLAREDTRQENDTLLPKLKEHGMSVNTPDPEIFRAALRDAKFYEEWKVKYGEQAWSTLEKYTGKLA